MNKTINDISAATRIELKKVIVGLGKETMIELMDSFKDTKYRSLGYRTIMATYGDCNDARAIGHFLDLAAGQLMPVSVMVNHVQLVAPADRSVIDWFISKGYYVENSQAPMYPMPPMTIPPPNPLQQAIVNLSAKLDEASAKIDVLSKSLRMLENENAALRDRNKELEKMLLELQKPKTPIVATTNFSGAKKYLHELSEIEMKWIHNSIYSEKPAMDIGIYMQEFHQDVCISERQIRANYGEYIQQIDVVKHLLYELSKYHEITILDLANTLKQLGLVVKGNDIIAKFNL